MTPAKPATVERCDREAAVLATGDNDLENLSKCARAFVEQDNALCTCNGDSSPRRLMKRVALAIATARQQGREAERADVVAWLRSPSAGNRESRGHWREEAWAKDIENGEHVGAGHDEG